MNMGSFFSTLVLGLIAALIGAAIQQRTWRYRALEELREKERAEARKTVELISEALDQRLHAQRTYTSVVLQGQASMNDVDAFKEATSRWMGGYSSNLSRLYHSFGRSTVIDFENKIQNNLQRASAIISLGRVNGIENLNERDRINFIGSEYRLSLIQREIYLFLNDLNGRISSGKIGRTEAINNLSAGNPSMISNVYLVRRLFGMEGNISQAY